MIYVVSSLGGCEAKIGYSTDESSFRARLSALQTAYPHKLKVLALDKHESATVEVEIALQGLFDSTSANNEWVVRCSLLDELCLRVRQGETFLELLPGRRKNLNSKVMYPKDGSNHGSIKAVVLGSNYGRVCPEPGCGKWQKLQLRMTADGVVRDQPKCCRGKKKS